MITTIKSDQFGLYVKCGGYIARPFFGTCFAEGDPVKTHHFSGSTKAGVTLPARPDTHNFKRTGQYEIWSTTGLSSYKYSKGDYTTEEIQDSTEWYKNHASSTMTIVKEHNRKFREEIDKLDKELFEIIKTQGIR